MSSQAYAPISSYSKTSANTLQFYDEISLSNSHREQEINESLAEIFSIITTLDLVEKSYLKDNISNDEYTQVVSKLISQYTTILKQPKVLEQFGDLDVFFTKYQINASNAKSRLEIGIPVTIEHQIPNIQHQSTGQTQVAGTGSGGNFKMIAETTGNFITLMDALKLNYKAKDQLYPLLSDLITNLNKLGKKYDELINWLIKLNKMNVLDELNDEDLRKFLFELDSSYKEFYTSLE